MQKAAHSPDSQGLAVPQHDSSAIPLQRHALRALRHQTAQARESRASQLIRHPATRLAVVEWKRHHQPLKPAHVYLKDCGNEHHKALLSISKHGGPDLQDLRGCQKAAYRMNDLMDSSQASSVDRSQSRHSTETEFTTEGGSSKSLSPYNRSFEQLPINHQVYPPDCRFPNGNIVPKPRNWDYINGRLEPPPSSQFYAKAEPRFDGNAYASLSIYYGGQLGLFTSQSTVPANAGEQHSYHMDHLGSFAMDSDEQTFRAGATWHRYSIELAQEIKDEPIRGVDEAFDQAPIIPFASNTGESFASTGDQLGLDSLMVDSQASGAQSITIDDYQTAEGSQDVKVKKEDGEDEPKPSQPLPAKRSSRSCT